MGKDSFLVGKGQPIVSYRNCVPRAVEKLLNWLICRLGCWVGGTQGTITWGQDPIMGRGNYSKRKAHTPTCPMTLCKNGWTDRDAIWVADSGAPKEACVTWEHIDATWKIWLKLPFAAAMRPYVKLLWPLVITVYPLIYSVYTDVCNYR